MLREGLGGGRQLALRERQRDVVGIPLAAHQHLAGADGLRDLPDARGLPRLPEPLADREVLRRLRRPLRLPREHPLQHRGHRRPPGRPRQRRGGRLRRQLARLRRQRGHDAVLQRAGRQRPPLGRALARAGLPRPGHLHRRADARARLPRARRARRQERARARDRQLGHRHRGRELADRRQDVPRDAPKRLHHPQVRPGQAHRRGRLAAADAPAARRSSASSSSRR